MLSAEVVCCKKIATITDKLSIKANRVDPEQTKNASENVVCCKKLPNITDKLSIEANSVDQEQTAPRSSLIWVHTVCHIGLKHFSRREKQTTFDAIGALRVRSLQRSPFIMLCLRSVL